MLKQIAADVLVHESAFMQSNAVVVQGPTGVLLIDAGLQSDEMICLSNDLRQLGQAVKVGFSTHPHWDHLLWHTEFGPTPRYSTARCADGIQNVLSQADWKARVISMLPREIAGNIPLDDQFGQVTGLPPDTVHVPWDGPKVRIIEHQAHAAGHAALLIEERRLLVAGDMLSDILIPILNLMAADPVDDYLAALQLFESVANKIDVIIPGHGSIGDTGQLGARIEQDRAYLRALHDAVVPDDPRLDALTTGIHERQVQQLSQRNKRKEDEISHG